MEIEDPGDWAGDQTQGPVSLETPSIQGFSRLMGGGLSGHFEARKQVEDKKKPPACLMREQVALRMVTGNSKKVAGTTLPAITFIADRYVSQLTLGKNRFHLHFAAAWTFELLRSSTCMSVLTHLSHRFSSRQRYLPFQPG